MSFLGEHHLNCEHLTGCTEEKNNFDREEVMKIVQKQQAQHETEIKRVLDDFEKRLCDTVRSVVTQQFEILSESNMPRSASAMRSDKNEPRSSNCFCDGGNTEDPKLRNNIDGPGQQSPDAVLEAFRSKQNRESFKRSLSTHGDFDAMGRRTSYTYLDEDEDDLPTGEDPSLKRDTEWDSEILSRGVASLHLAGNIEHMAESIVGNAEHLASSVTDGVRNSVSKKMHDLDNLGKEIAPTTIAELEQIDHWIQKLYVEFVMPCSDRSEKLVSHPCFEYMIGLTIVVYTVFHSMSLNNEIRKEDLLEDEIVLLSTVFNVIFLIELLLRIIAYGTKFLSIRNPDVRWNVLDTVLVLSWLIEVLESGSNDATYVNHILRMLRCLRVIRIMRFFREIRVLVDGISCAFQPFFFCTVSLFLFIFTFATFVMEIAVLQKVAPIKGYDSILGACYLLFQAITGGISWGEAAAPLENIGDFMLVLFVIFVSFALFCLFNVMVGVFVDSAQGVSLANRDQAVLSAFINHIDALNMRSKRATDIYLSMMDSKRNANTDGRRDMEQDHIESHLSKNDFISSLRDAAVIGAFTGLSLDATKESEMKKLFSMLDYDNDGTLTEEEWVRGLTDIDQQASKLQLHFFQQTCSKHFKLVEYFLAHFKQDMIDIISAENKSVRL